MGSVYGAGEALDLHWAVSAIDTELRDAAIARAEAVAAQAGWPAVDDTEREPIELLAGAYDLAVRDRLEMLARLGAGEQADDLHAQIEWGAARAFALHAALSLPDDESSRLFRVLHLAALAAVSGRRADWDRWAAEYPLPPSDLRAGWDAVLLRHVVEIWCELLDRSGPSGLARPMELIAELREERPRRERDLLASQDAADGARMRFYLFALYHLADAATDLLLYLSHGRPTHIVLQLDAHFALANEATSGDFRLAVLLGWVQAAAQRVAGRRTPQLEIPGVHV